MKKRITKILGVVLTLALLSSLAMTTAPVLAHGTVADGNAENEWAEIDLPVLSPDTNLAPLAVAPNGTIYMGVCYLDMDAADGWYWKVVKSDDGGITWGNTSLDELELWDSGDGVGAIVDIVVAPDGTTVYVACLNGDIYRLEDEGDADPQLLREIENSFGTLLSDISGGYFNGYGGALYDIDVWNDGDDNWVLAACDLDVLVLMDAWAEEWKDFDLVAGDDEQPAYEAAFQPGFGGGGQDLIWAVTEDSSGHFLVTATNMPSQWGTTIEELVVWDADDNPIDASRYVDLAFDTNYDPEAPIMFLALSDADWGNGDMNLGNGNLYFCEFAVLPGTATSYGTALIGDNIDMCSVEVSGDVILGGALQAPMTYRSDDYGNNMQGVTKNPTGWGYVYNPWSDSDEQYSLTNVVMAPGAFDPDDGVAYISTIGAESAFSRSRDGGDTYNQISWWDTSIDEMCSYGDIAFSTDFPSGSTILLITWGTSEDEPYYTSPTSYGTTSLWRTSDDTAQEPTWERVLCARYGSPSGEWPGNFEYDIYKVEYALDGSAVYIFGEDSYYYIWKSTDNAQTFAGRRMIDTEINEWVIPTSKNIFAATDNGFYRTDTSGLVWHTQEDLDGIAGADMLVSIALEPGNPIDGTILVGDDNGNAYVSTDGGELWGPPNDVGSGWVLVAFDAEFGDNDTVYTATSANSDKVKTAKVTGSGQTAKFATGSLKDLKDSAGDVPTGPFNGLQVADDNALYAMHGGVSGTSGDAGDVTVTGTIAVACVPVNSSTDLVVEDKEVTVISGAFDDGELVSIIEYDLVCTFDRWELFGDMYIGWGQISGMIGVQGVDSGATGSFEITPDQYDIDVWGYELPCWEEEAVEFEKGSFESGDLSGWIVNGMGASVEVLQSTNITPAIIVPDGNYLALLSTGPGTVDPGSDIDIDGSGYLNSDTATMSQTFTIDIPKTLSFDWAWMTDEEDQSAEYDDIFHVTLNGTIIASGSVDATAGDTSPYPNVVTDDIIYTVSSLGPTNGSLFGDGGSLAGWATVNYAITTPGTYTLEFLVADNGNHSMDSGLLIDNVRLDDALLTHPGAPADPIVTIKAVQVISSFLMTDIVGVVEEEDDEPAGLWRLLLHESDNIWEFANDSDLEDPCGLWLTKPTNVLWTIDDDDNELWVIEDTCSGKVTLVSPADGTLLPATDEADVEWEAVNGAKKYDVKYDSTWLDPPTSKTAITLTGLTAGKTYDWKARVAVGAPWHSRWSSSWEFSMAPMAPVNQVPANGAQDMPLNPSFGWTAVSDAISYDFELGMAPDFSDATAVTTTATFLTWETELLYDQNYYWRVRAVTATGVSAWCESNFHTRVEAFPPVTVEPPPTPTINLPQPTVTVNVPDVNVTLPPPQVTVIPPDITVDVPPVVTVTQQPQPTLVLPVEEDPGTPVYIWVIVAIGAILTIAVIVLIIRTRRVV